jgi:hypothetical protein
MSSIDHISSQFQIATAQIRVTPRQKSLAQPLFHLRIKMQVAKAADPVYE